MTAPVTLLFGVHAHQPVGNFVSVVDDAAERCYWPFLATMARHPRVKFALHVSGWLIERLAERRPDVIALVRQMAARRQVEIVGGGDMEPVLAAIPEADRRTQLRALAARTSRHFGVRPRGAWLAERVWDASVVPALARYARYTLVDDYHFITAGVDLLDGYFTTEENGSRIDVFPISQAMRYRVPFAPAEHVLAHLASLPAGSAVTYFDDIEKFGIWPETQAWVYAGGWLERFASALERSTEVITESFSGYHARASSRGIVYLPATSYAEMKDWVPGGVWKGFLAKYPESNWMHKRMLGVSRSFRWLPAQRRTPQMLALLHKSQSNDAYWHGMFGGVYLPHLRRAIWRALLALEAQLPPPKRPMTDVDLDGRDEIALRCADAVAFVRADADAAVVEFSAYRLRHNFCDTLRRRWEPYYERVGQAAAGAAGHGGIASAHDRIAYRSRVSRVDLAVDERPRSSFVDFWDGRPVAYAADDPLDAAEPRFLSAGPKIAKTYRLRRGALACAYALGGTGRLAVQLNIAMPSCDGPGGHVVHRGQRLGGFADERDLDGVDALRLTDDELGGALAVACSPQAEVRLRPTFTVSQSEAGFEKIMQSIEMTFAWRVDGRADVTLELQPEQ